MTAQNGLTAVDKAPKVWTADTDPIVAPGPTGTGTHRTKSGKLVNDAGIYVSGLPNVTVQKAIESGAVDPTTALPNLRKPVAIPIIHYRPSTGSPMTVAERQALLRNAGFNVTVDGVLGPQTRTSWNAYVKGTPASYWNHAWASDHTPTAPASTPPAATDSSAGAGAPPANTPVRKPTSATKSPAAVSPAEQAYWDYIFSPYKGMTTAQMLAQAKQIAGVELQPQIASVQTQEAQATADATRNAQFEANLGQALASVLGTQGTQTQDAYHDAGADDATFAKGYSGDLADTAQSDADKVNAVLASIGAPAGQTISPAKATDLGNVSYGLGGAIPAESLAREGAAFTAAANQEPASMIGLGAENAANALLTGHDNVTKLAQSLAQLEQQRPGLIQSALSSLQSSEVQQAGLDQNQKELMLLARGDANKVLGTDPVSGKPTVTQTDVDLKNYDARVKAAEASAKVAPQFSPSASNSLGYKADQYGNPILDASGQPQLLPGYAFDHDGDVVKKSTTNSGRVHGLTTTQVLKFKGAALSIAENAYQGIAAGSGTTSWNSQHPHGLPPVSYDQAVNEMITQGLPAWIYIPALNLYYKDANTNPYAYGPPAPTTGA